MVIHNLFFISVICTLPTALESEASKQSQSENNAICDVVSTYTRKKVNFSPGLLQYLKRFEFAKKSEVYKQFTNNQKEKIIFYGFKIDF